MTAPYIGDVFIKYSLEKGSMSFEIMNEKLGNYKLQTDQQSQDNAHEISASFLRSDFFQFSFRGEILGYMTTDTQVQGTLQTHYFGEYQVQTSISDVLGDNPALAATFDSEQYGKYSFETFGKLINSNQPEWTLNLAKNDERLLEQYTKLRLQEIDGPSPGINLEIKINDIYVKLDCELTNISGPDFGVSLNIDASFLELRISFSASDLDSDSANIQINLNSLQTDLNILIDLKQINSQSPQFIIQLDSSQEILNLNASGSIIELNSENPQINLKIQTISNYFLDLSANIQSLYSDTPVFDIYLNSSQGSITAVGELLDLYSDSPRLKVTGDTSSGFYSIQSQILNINSALPVIIMQIDSYLGDFHVEVQVLDVFEPNPYITGKITSNKYGQFEVKGFVFDLYGDNPSVKAEIVSVDLEYQYTFDGQLVNIYSENVEGIATIHSFGKKILGSNGQIHNIFGESPKLTIGIDSDFGQLDLDFKYNKPFVTLNVDTHNLYGKFYFQGQLQDIYTKSPVLAVDFDSKYGYLYSNFEFSSIVQDSQSMNISINSSEGNFSLELDLHDIQQEDPSFQFEMNSSQYGYHYLLAKAKDIYDSSPEVMVRFESHENFFNLDGDLKDFYELKDPAVNLNVSSSRGNVIVQSQIKQAQTDNPNFEFYFDVEGYDFEMEMELEDIELTKFISDFVSAKSLTSQNYYNIKPSIYLSFESTTLNIQSDFQEELPQIEASLTTPSLGPHSLSLSYVDPSLYKVSIQSDLTGNLTAISFYSFPYIGLDLLENDEDIVSIEVEIQEMNDITEIIFFEAEVMTKEWGTFKMIDNNLTYSLERPQIFLNVATDLYGLWRVNALSGDVRHSQSQIQGEAKEVNLEYVEVWPLVACQRLQVYHNCTYREQVLGVDFIELDIKLDTTLSAYAQFGGDETFIQTISNASNIKIDDFEVIQVWEGSVNIKFRVYGESDISLEDLEDLFSNLFKEGEIDLGSPIEDLQFINPNGVNPTIVIQDGQVIILEPISWINQNGTQLNLDTYCNSQVDSLFSDESAKTEIQEYFNLACFKKNECEFDQDNMPRPFLELFSGKCKNRINKRHGTQLITDKLSSNQFIMIAGCRKDYLHVPLTEQTFLHKEEVGILIVLFDIVGILITLMVFKNLKKANADLLEIIDNNSMTMKDFTVYCKDVICDRHTQDSRLIKMKIWLHFTKLLKPHRLEDNQQKVVDVTLSMSTQPKLTQIFKIEKTQKSIETIRHNIKGGWYKGSEFYKKQDELEDLLTLYESQRMRYNALLNEENSQTSTPLKGFNSAHGPIVEYIFVTFKNNESTMLAADISQPEPVVQKCLRRICCIKNKQQQKREFQFNEIDVKQSVEPDEILWENMSFTKKDTSVRQNVIHVIAICVSILSAAVVLLLDFARQKALKENPKIDCPSEEFTPEQTYYDLKAYNSYGLIQCFCQNLKNKSGVKQANSHTFQEISVHKEDETKYCQQESLSTIYTEAVVMAGSVSLVVFNGIIAQIIKKLGDYQKKHTTIETNQKTFFNIFALEFCNTALILLVISFTPIGQIYQKSASDVIYHKEGDVILNGYSGFQADWYQNVGRIICITILISSFVANSFDLRSFYYWSLKQWNDRKFSSSLKKFPHAEYDDTPKTKQWTQQGLNRLYHGQECSGDRKVSRMMSTLFVVLFYSSGMPVLYLLAGLFFTFTFFVNKLLFLRYYQRTENTLSRDLPMYSAEVLQIAVMLKLFMGLFMYADPEVWQSRKPLSSGGGKALPDEMDIKSTIMQHIDGDHHDGVDEQLDKYSLNFIELRHQQIYIAFIIAYILYLVFGTFFTNLFKFIITIVTTGTIKIFKAIQSSCLCLCLSHYNKFLRQFCLKWILKCCIKKQDKNAIVDINKHEKADKAVKDLVESMSDRKLSRDSEDPDSSVQDEPDQQEISGIFDLQSARQQHQDAELKMFMEKQNKIRKSRPDYSDNFYKELRIDSLTSLYKRANDEYRDFRNYFKLDITTEQLESTVLIVDEKSKKREVITAQLNELQKLNFLEICYQSNVTQEEVSFYDSLLSQRIHDIKSTIDDHFSLIKPVIQIQKKKKRDSEIQKISAREKQLVSILRNVINQEYKHDADLKFDDSKIYTYDKKLTMLRVYHTEVVKQDKRRIENRKSVQTVCRLKGSKTQSYFIFDSQRFYVAKQIYYQLLKEENERRNVSEIEDFLSSDFDYIQKSSNDQESQEFQNESPNEQEQLNSQQDNQ